MKNATQWSSPVKTFVNWFHASEPAAGWVKPTKPLASFNSGSKNVDSYPGIVGLEDEHGSSVLDESLSLISPEQAGNPATKNPTAWAAV